MPNYIALIHKEPGSAYGVSFPDFPGCISAGDTLDEARAMAAEALALHLEGLTDDGQALPEPSSFEAILGKPDALGLSATVIEPPLVELDHALPQPRAVAGLP